MRLLGNNLKNVEKYVWSGQICDRFCRFFAHFYIFLDVEKNVQYLYILHKRKESILYDMKLSKW